MIASPLMVMPAFTASSRASADLAPGVVGAVAADVDDPARRVQAALGQQLHGLVDAGADRGAAPEGARRCGQLVGEGLRPRRWSLITVQSSTVRTSKLLANST